MIAGQPALLNRRCRGRDHHHTVVLAGVVGAVHAIMDAFFDKVTLLTAIFMAVGASQSDSHGATNVVGVLRVWGHNIFLPDTYPMELCLEHSVHFSFDEIRLLGEKSWVRTLA